jgi:hypothetical protein
VDKAAPGCSSASAARAAAGLTLAAARSTNSAPPSKPWRASGTPADLLQRVETDGELARRDLTYDFARLLREQRVGPGIPEPRFEGGSRSLAQKVVGEKHLKLGSASRGRATRRSASIQRLNRCPLPPSTPSTAST